VSWLKSTNICRTHLRNAQLESQYGRILVLPKRYNAVTGQALQRELDLVVAVLFDAPIVPATCFKIVEHQLHISGRRVVASTPNFLTDPDTVETLIHNVQHGVWSCFLLQTGYEENKCQHSFLVVRWVYEQTAERVSCFTWTTRDAYELIHAFESILERGRVRLV
jgi:hypothetical protein